MASTQENNKTKTNPTKPLLLQHHQNNNYFIIYRVLTFTLFLIILPLFPSQAPDFINKALITHRTWELLHLLFVGLAVSYGLFSRRNSDLRTQTHKKPDKNHETHYVSRLLEVSSVFDDVADDRDHDQSVRSSTWSSQYYRTHDPVVVVPTAAAAGEDGVRGKSLPLPVRSLKENISSSVVLPSPIPWRSRSGRFEVRESGSDSPQPESSKLPKSSEDFALRKTHKSFPPPPPPPPPPPSYYGSSAKSGEKGDLVGKVVMESEESESDGDEIVRKTEDYYENINDDNKEESGGADVDKKADEFIAKFREQIRLQRIESIKRSSAQMSRNMSR